MQLVTPLQHWHRSWLDLQMLSAVAISWHVELYILCFFMFAICLGVRIGECAVGVLHVVDFRCIR